MSHVDDILLQWYKSYSDMLFKYIVGMMKDIHESEDIMQETFIRAHKQLSTSGTVDHPKAFLFKIAHNLAIDHLRKYAPINMMKDILQTKRDPKPSIESIIEFKEDTKKLYEALRKIKSAYREVIILRRIEEFTIKETAQILNWSEGKVKTKLFRALQALEREFEKEREKYEVSPKQLP